MRTTKATAKQIEQFDALCNSSVSYAELHREVAKFYANNASWDGLDAEFKIWKEACKNWNAELLAAGFHIAVSGIRVIKG